MPRILLQLGGPLLCIALTIGLLLTGKASISGAQATASPALTLETPDLSDVPSQGDDLADGEAAESAGGAGQADANDAGDDAVPLAPLSSAPEPPPSVTSAPLPAPLPAPSSPPAAHSDEREETILRHPIVLAAGLVAFAERSVQLAGLKPEDASRVCPQTDGSWPCGAVARTAFRNFIRARAFTCLTPKGGWTGTTTAHCTIGPDDPASWLAENGWAEPEETAGPLQAAAEVARRTGKGFYRKPTALPGETAPAP